MLTKLLNLNSYEQMRSFVQDISKPANITILVMEIKSSNITFSPEILNNSENFDFTKTAELNATSSIDRSALCYRKLLWVMKTNPIISIKVQQLIDMFKE